MHLLENRHSIGHTDDIIMEILYITNKGRLMDTIEKYYSYKETKNGNQINDKNTTKQNKTKFMVQQFKEKPVDRAHETRMQNSNWKQSVGRR